jgi:hypothetical protein
MREKEAASCRGECGVREGEKLRTKKRSYEDKKGGGGKTQRGKERI